MLPRDAIGKSGGVSLTQCAGVATAVTMSSPFPSSDEIEKGFVRFKVVYARAGTCEPPISLKFAGFVDPYLMVFARGSRDSCP